MSGNIKFWIGLGVSVVLLALFLLTIDIGDMLEALGGANYWFVAPAIGVYLVSVLFRTLRWRRLLLHMRAISLVRLYPVVVVGYMANDLLPMRIGELVRSYYVGEREGVSKTSALVTIFIERLLDAITLLLFIAVIALFAPLTGLAQAFEESHGAVWLLLGVALAVLFVAAFGFLLLVAFAPSTARAMAMAVTRPLPERLSSWLRGMFDLVLNGLKPLGSPRTVLVLFLQSVPIWLLESGLFYLIGLSFGFDEVYDSPTEMAMAMVLVTAIANIGASVPAAPGGIGLFDIIARETLVLLPLATVDRAVAGGYVAVVHAALLLPMIILGQIFLWAHQVSLGTLSRAGQSAAGKPNCNEADPAPEELSAPERGEGGTKG